MSSNYSIVPVLMLLVIVPQTAAAADKPSELIVGKWKDRAEPDDAVIEFSKDGTGKITETTAQQTKEAGISWKVTGTYGNACVILIKYVHPKPLPKEAKPMTWLIAFDGKDRFVSQPRANTIVVMERQK
jgi:hypothetical protein